MLYMYNPFISLELVQIFEYRDITSNMMMRTSKLRKFLFKFSVKTGVSHKEYFERGWRWWSERMNWSKIAKKRWHRSTIGLMKFHEIAYSFPTRTAPMIWISKIACSFSPRWFLDRNFDEIGEAKGETKLSLILDTGFSPLPLPRKTARNESDTREQRSKRSPSFDSTIFQFWKSNYLTIRHTAGGGYFIKTCNSIQKRGRR